MVEEITAVAAVPRPDVDIAADIDNLLTVYPPMVKDRDYVHYTVDEGAVTLAGHVRTGITRRYITETVQGLPGVKSLDDSQLYDDGALRLEAGQVIPVGVMVSVEYGVVILSGHLPAGANERELVSRIEALPGIRAVRTNFLKLR